MGDVVCESTVFEDFEMNFFLANIFCLFPAFFSTSDTCHPQNRIQTVMSTMKGVLPVKEGVQTAETAHRRAGKEKRNVQKKHTKRARITRSSTTSRITQKTPDAPPIKPTDGSTESDSRARSKPTASKKSELDLILDGLQSYYQTQKDLKADFVQTYTYVKMGRKKISKGRVFFKTPHRMRFDYQSPHRKLIISDGQTLWIYEPDQFQAFKRDLRGSQLPVAMTFMSGQGDLRAEFTGKLLSKESGKAIIELIPKANEGDYRALRLEVDLKTFAVHSSTVVDPVGNLNEIRFSKLATNTDLPDAGFRFQVPAGVTVIE